MKQQMQLLLILGGALVLAGCATTGGSKSSVADDKTAGRGDIYLEGMAYFTQSRAPAEKCLINVGELKNKSWKALMGHANGCVKANDWKSLDMIAQEIASQDLNSPWGAYYLSVAAENTQDLPRALWMIDLSLKKAPSAGLFRYQKGRVLWKLKNTKQAVEEVTAAVKREPRLMDAHIFLAQTFHRDLNLGKAESHYEKALAIDGRNRLCLEGMGDIRMGQGKSEKAAEFYTSAVATVSDDLHLRLKLAQAHEATSGSQELALANYRAVRDLASRSKGKLDFDLNDKIKTLEQKVMESKTGKQAKLDEKGQPAGKRAPANAERRTTK